MNRFGLLSNVVSKLLYFALLGLLAIVLVGPVLGVMAAIISVAFSVTAAILPFALLGLLIWIPYCLCTHGPKTTWREVRNTGKSTYRSTLARPMNHCASACRQTWGVGQAAWSKFRPRERCQQVHNVCAETAAATGSTVRRGTHRLVEIVVEVFSGALIGMLVGFLWAWQTQHPPIAGLIGAGAGTVAGVLVAISRRLG